MANKIVNVNIELENCESCGKPSIMELNTHDEDGNATCASCMIKNLLDVADELKSALILTSNALSTHGRHPLIEEAVKRALNLY